MTEQELESYAIENILKKDSIEAFMRMKMWIEGAIWMQEKLINEIKDNMIKDESNQASFRNDYLIKFLQWYNSQPKEHPRFINAIIKEFNEYLKNKST